MEKLELNNRSFFDKIIGFCLQNKLVVTLTLLLVIVAGIMVAPFDWELGGLPRDPVPVDAIPDIGENQQIVFIDWMGRSPQDVENQITYPLTVSLLGVPGVKTIRAYSMFGFSSIYIIFNEKIEYYWSRSRILERLNSLPAGILPEGVKPILGPDATALGQIFWYTLEGRDNKGHPTGGWDLQELRSIQDWQVRFALLSAEGVAEVASVGGFVKEYQIDVNPQALQVYGIELSEIMMAVKRSNKDVGARTIEINQVQYMLRGRGLIQQLSDIEQIAVKMVNGVAVKIRDIARVSLGPAFRSGVLDKAGAEAVGGVVVARYGDNPLQVIKNVKKKIRQIENSLPKKTLSGGTVSQIRIVPFYDRTGLIYETLGTLYSALVDEVLFTIVVILITVMHLRSSLLISSLLPITILLCFIGMKWLKVDANVVALSGIAIAIGEIVDMGIVLCENMLKHLERAKPEESRLKIIFEATSEVGSAVLTSVSTTIVGFLPVFFLTGAEGKLFKPLAYTKTLAMAASILLALVIIPPFAHLLFTAKIDSRRIRRALYICIILVGALSFFFLPWWAAVIMIAIGIIHLMDERQAHFLHGKKYFYLNGLVLLATLLLVSHHWLPLGPAKGLFLNFILSAFLIGGIMGLFIIFEKKYPNILSILLERKKTFLVIPGAIVLIGLVTWLGFPGVLKFTPDVFRHNFVWSFFAHQFPGLGKEFMPDLDEGSFLFMPSTMAHASQGEAYDVLQKQDLLIQSIPEIEMVVGKMGRVESSLDPAPISMYETVVNYKSEYILGKSGQRLRFRYDRKKKEFMRDEEGNLIEDSYGRPFRQWRERINSPDDIWQEILAVTNLTGTTSAPKLQPIKTRIVMLQSGMRAAMGVKIKGPNLASIEQAGIEIERLLKQVPGVEPATVVADRVVGAPYLEINIKREAIARYGLTIQDVQDIIEVAVGGEPLMLIIEGRERYPLRIRYQRELRNSPEVLGKILVPVPQQSGGMSGKGRMVQIPLSQLAEIQYTRGPQMIKSENTELVSYVTFDKRPGAAEVDVVEQAQAYLKDRMVAGVLNLPKGVHYEFAGNYENQIRATQRFIIIIPLSLFIIYMILYFQFKNIWKSLLVFSGILVGGSGGFILLYLYGQSWFMNFSVFGVAVRELFQIHPINLSVAVWVGFLALFGIATSDGVLMCTYLDQSFASLRVNSIEEIRKAVILAGNRRIRPCLMTVATTILALIPVFTSTGKGADVMVPMAIPSFGGMTVVLITLFVVPVIYCAVEEMKFKLAKQ